jgi:phosphohistidine phosphatase
MKRLAVLRHAKSSWADAGMEDFDRPLNDRGRAAARLIGAELARRKLRFNLVLASTAARVRETIDGVKREYRFDSEIRFEPRIYEASAGRLLELVRALPDPCESVLLVGHNPGLQELLLDLTDRDETGLRDRVREKYPTAALAVVEFPADRWAKLRGGSGRIVDLIVPRDLAGDG